MNHHLLNEIKLAVGVQSKSKKGIGVGRIKVPTELERDLN